jgi:hypothetical protein
MFSNNIVTQQHREEEKGATPHNIVETIPTCTAVCHFQVLIGTFSTLQGHSVPHRDIQYLSGIFCTTSFQYNELHNPTIQGIGLPYRDNQYLTGTRHSVPQRDIQYLTGIFSTTLQGQGPLVPYRAGTKRGKMTHCMH